MLDRPQAEEALMYGTTRIDCEFEKDGRPYKTEGTAFFFNLDYNAGSAISFLVTTKHTVENTNNSKIHLHLAANDNGQGTTIDDQEVDDG